MLWIPAGEGGWSCDETAKTNLPLMNPPHGFITRCLREAGTHQHARGKELPAHIWSFDVEIERHRPINLAHTPFLGIGGYLILRCFE
jgi:hypothetical protein